MVNKVSKTTINLVEKLRNIFDDHEFVLGILAFVDTESDRKTLLDFINTGKDVDIETVTILALELNDNHEV